TPHGDLSHPIDPYNPHTHIPHLSPSLNPILAPPKLILRTRQCTPYPSIPLPTPLVPLSHIPTLLGILCNPTLTFLPVVLISFILHETGFFD
uniref:hypothetical protein n=1 Tax=Kocuria salsicia TaxID=664639 RepID=UPI0028D12006